MWMLALLSVEAHAKEWFVAPDGTGNGADARPFGSIQEALRVAEPGDAVIVRRGTYTESIRTVRSGSAGAPIVIRGEGGPDAVVITKAGIVLQIAHSFVTIENLAIDAAYAQRTAVKVAGGAQAAVLRRVEIRRSGRDCVDIGAAIDVLIEDSSIHHCLNAATGRTDAHGVVAGAVKGLTLRGTDIHSFSGDAIQLNRTGTELSDGWTDVLIERCRFWLAPLTSEENGFPAGAITGENALDTKVAPTSPRARITIRDTQAWGFGGGLINVQAAFNLKENIDATIDGVTVSKSEVAFRIRGSVNGKTGARVRMQNVVLYDVAVGVRYEDVVQDLRIWNSTFGRNVTRTFADASSAGRTKPDVRNVAFLQADLPVEADDASNLAVNEGAFVNAAEHDYRPAAGSRLIDAGVAIEDVESDRTGNRRPQGDGIDVGAYELR